MKRMNGKKYEWSEIDSRVNREYDEEVKHAPFPVWFAIYAISVIAGFVVAHYLGWV